VAAVPCAMLTTSAPFSSNVGPPTTGTIAVRRRPRPCCSRNAARRSWEARTRRRRPSAQRRSRRRLRHTCTIPRPIRPYRLSRSGTTAA